MKRICIFIFMLIVFASCRTIKYVDRVVVDSTEIAVPMTNTKIEYRDRFVYDSIYVRDSIYTYVKGDTVYISKDRETKHLGGNGNTNIKTDTIHVPVEVVKVKTETKTEIQVKEVNKLYWWQKVAMYIGLGVLIGSIVFLIIKLKKRF